MSLTESANNLTGRGNTCCDGILLFRAILSSF
jgi:hypothetical protein